MSDRYFVESPVTSDRAVLAGAEAHHLLHVMRAKAGEQVTLFDGSGWEFEALVQRLGRSEVELAVVARREIDREAVVALTLGVALPKGDRQKWLVEKIVELGVARLIPLETERGVAQPVANALERLRRTVIEASKQCGRNRLMEIAEPRAWKTFLAEYADVPCRMVAHPIGAAANSHSPLTDATYAWPTGEGHIVMAAGPEGGFTEEEAAQAVAQGWQPIDLGPRILRVETAAIALAAISLILLGKK